MEEQSGNVQELKAWLLQFAPKIQLGHSKQEFSIPTHDGPVFHRR
jgi:hypothetical protein